jgi:inhibitor of KinA sporulation pathway (predicted exonuclease)
MRVLTNEFDRIGVKFPDKPVVDPFIFYKWWHKYSKGKTLVKAADTYGIPYQGAHRAVNDSIVTGQLLFKMAATKTAFPRTLDLLVKKQRTLIEEQFIDLNAYFIKIGKGPIEPPNYKFYDWPRS